MSDNYTTQTWTDEVLAGDERYDIKEDGGSAFKSTMRIELATAVAQAGTSLSAERMNHIESGIANVDTALTAAIAAINAALGSDPGGSSADLTARLAALDTLLGASPAGLHASIAARLDASEAGWVRVAASGTYVSATSFTVNGDLTAFFKYGIPLKYVNSTTKYNYVSSSSYSSGTGKTTVNLIASTSYALANAAVTAIDISYGKPADFPVTFSYTPTITTPSGAFTSVSASGAYSIVNGRVFVDVAITITTVGTATGVIFTLPRTVSTLAVFLGRENAVTGNMLQGLASSGSVSVFTYSGGSPVGNGYQLYVGGNYASS